MDILLVYPGPRHSTYELALGWHEVFAASEHTVYAFPYQDYWDFYGGAIAYWQKANPDFGVLEQDKAVELRMRLASERIGPMLIDIEPELIIIVCGLQLHARAFHLMDKFDAARVVILTESPYLDRKQGVLIDAGHCDLAFTNDKTSIAALEEIGRQPVVYLPHSYSPQRHNVAQVGAEYQSDVYFYGTAWPERQELFGSLDRNGRDVNITGVGWHEGVGDSVYVMDNADVANFYRGTKIALNHHRQSTEIDLDTDNAKGKVSGAWSIGPRAYEIAACGAFQLSDNGRPELVEVFGDSVATYRGAVDLQDKVNYYLACDGERLGMAAAAHEAVRDCTFDNRAEQIFWPAVEKWL